MLNRQTDKGLIDIACTLQHETERAWLIDTGDPQPVWIPKSQGEYYAEGKTEIMTMPMWLAREKGLI